MATLYIIRGIPGSGKSTLAKKLAKQLGIGHFEADMYFMKDGEYKFDKTRLGPAHEWCYRETTQNLWEGQDVIVSNTFTTSREMEDYFSEAERLCCKVKVITCLSDFGSVHNVPEEAMQRMRNRFITGEQLEENMKLMKWNFTITFENHQGEYDAVLPVEEFA